ncbi:hypothetical protein [Halorubrum sp. CSM-61]|uniref:hypothetical protein n=1 Tax=Halorubrum sp. CSM-61 TaxID=2485838 RepID=UPI000F4CFF44|nr:hypothetical protein [Halorubrum sp. CSM-61]
MFRGTPNCPECGSRFLVTSIRMNGGYVPPPDMSVYRCYRCFAKFTDEDVAEAEDGAGVDDGETSETGPPVRVADVDVAVSRTGEKRAVDRFDLVLRNDGTEPVRVARTTLAFPDGEESVVPVDPVVLDPDETATVAVPRDWLHAGQDAVTVRLVGDGDVVGSVRVADLD